MSDLPLLLMLAPVALAAGATLASYLVRWRLNRAMQRERQRLERVYMRNEYLHTRWRPVRSRSLQADQMAHEAARKAAERWMEEYEAKRRRWSMRVPRPPRRSLSQLMVRGAVSRLPIEMDGLEKARWEEEMVADVAAIASRWQRLRYAFGILRKGAPKMPAGGAGVPRSVD